MVIERFFMKRKIYIFTILIIFLLICIFGCNYYFRYKLDSNKIIINYSTFFNDDFLYDISINYNGNKKGLLCSIDNKNWLKLDDCKFNLLEGNYNLFLKNQHFAINKKFEVKKQIIGSFTSSLDNLDTYYLALGGSKEVIFTFTVLL